MVLSRPLSARDLFTDDVGKLTMIVRIPSPLRSYTKQRGDVDVNGETVEELLANLDCQHPGIRFRMLDEQDRIRQHIKIFVNTEEIHDLSWPIKAADVVHIICALSGG